MNFQYVQISAELNILKRDIGPCNILLYQHEGELTGSPVRIGNRTASYGPLRAFFVKAKETEADLALTPEYSCPFNVLMEVLADQNRWPLQHKLWAVCTESVSREVMEELLNYLSDPRFNLTFDHSVMQSAGNFVNPIFYLYTNTDGSLLHVIIQCKIFPMSARREGIVELNNLIPGKTIYVLRHETPSNYLMTLICSEAMNFPAAVLAGNTRTLLEWDEKAYLILNPMVNPDPAHQHFLDFRRFVLDSERKEIISLNWNGASMLAGNRLVTHLNSRTAVHMQSNDIEQKNKDLIRANQKLGLFYCYLGASKYGFIFHSDPHLFLFSKAPVYVTGGVNVQRVRPGPIMKSVYIFAHGAFADAAPPTEHYLTNLTNTGCYNLFVNDPNNCPLEKERLACLSTCEVKPAAGPQWFELNNLSSVRLDELETCRRFTMYPDSSAHSNVQRSKYISAIVLLDHILTQKNLYPASISDLVKRHVRLAYKAGKNPSAEDYGYRYNLVSDDGEEVFATVAFLECPNSQQLRTGFETLQKMFGPDNRHRERVVIFHRCGQNIKAKSDSAAASYTADGQFSQASILNTNA
jgi:hypothetical protein